MSAAPSPEEALSEATLMLQQNRPPEQVVAALGSIAAGEPHFAQAQYLRGICALRDADFEAAKHLLIDAARGGHPEEMLWVALARAAAGSGMPDDALAALLDGLTGLPGPALTALLPKLLRALAINGEARNGRKAFTGLVIPLLAALLARRDMDAAIALEGIVYDKYVKAIETEAHFGWCMSQIAPLFTEAGEAWRKALPALPAPPLTPPYKVGFFIHGASMLAHIEILLNTLRGYRTLGDQPFEPTVYCLSRRDAVMEAALAGIGVRLVMLNERFPEAGHSTWQRLLGLREMLSEEGVQELVWISRVTIMPLAFALRLAPVQVWFCMKYHNLMLPQIDGYVCARHSNRFGMLAGRQWRMARLAADHWYDPDRTAQAEAIRASLQASVVLMTLGRSEKMQDPAFLSAITTLLRTHPEALFIWAGREESPRVVAAFKTAGVHHQTRFIGWVDTLVYAQVGDIFVDSFPFPCGVTLIQAMAAGKPVVLYDSVEAAQTGVWAYLKPWLAGEGVDDAERTELLSLVGDRDNPLVAVARTPEEYVRHVDRLIEDHDRRDAAGAASRAIVEGYFSDLRGMAASMSRHLVELIDEARPRNDIC